MNRLRLAAATLALSALLQPQRAAAQAPAPAVGSVQTLSPEAIDGIIAGARPDDPATLTLANREIVVVRAALVGRSSADRVQSGSRILAEVSREHGPFEVSSRMLGRGAIVSVNGRDVIAIVPADVDQLLGETVERAAAAATARLEQALGEVAEANHPRLLLWELAQAVGGTLAWVGILWLLARARRWSIGSLEQTAARTLSRFAVGGQHVRRTRLLDYMSRLVTGFVGLVALALGYVWLFFTLRRFPYTRPWGESLRGFLLDQAAWFGGGVLRAIPNLFTIVLIAAAAGLVIRMVRALFAAAGAGRIALPGIYPETAAPTRKLITALLWLFTLVIVYPYLPGSGTDAFKGASVLLGVVVSFGSSGVMNQIVSGFTVLYARGLGKGDFVRVSDVEGTVVQIGMLSTKIETPHHVEVTIPNAVLISQTVTNFSRNAETTGVFIPASVTIGYDAPWRQVEAMLLQAASRTAGVRRTPAPAVRQDALEDFYVRYTLLVSLEHPHKRGPVLTELHAHIQDTFNEHGVQIMSPNYVADPSAPKIVPKDQWFAAPAVGRPVGGDQ